MNIYLILGIAISIYILLSIIELIGLHRFNLRFYNYGFKIFEKNIKYKFSNWNNLDEIYTKKEGKYVFIPEEKVGYFVTNFNFYRVYSPIVITSGIPLTIFGKIKDENNEVKLAFYISYRVVSILGLWFLTIILISIFSCTLMALAIGIFGIIFTLGLLFVVKIFYEGKMLMMIDEISNVLRIRKQL